MVLTSHAQISAIFLQLIVGITDQKSTVTKKNRIKARWLQLYGTFFCPGGDRNYIDGGQIQALKYLKDS